MEWVCFGRGHFVPEILQKKLAPMIEHYKKDSSIMLHPCDFSLEFWNVIYVMILFIYIYLDLTDTEVVVGLANTLHAKFILGSSTHNHLL